MIRIPRLPWPSHFMLAAHLGATRSTCDRGPELLFDPGRHGVGCVLVRENRMVAGGYNGSPPGQPHCFEVRCRKCKRTAPTLEELKHINMAHWQPGENVRGHKTLDHFVEGGHLLRDGHCVRALHAEENALMQCAMDGVSSLGLDLYTTASPCWDCAKRAVRAGIRRVFYAEEYGSRYGLSNDAIELLRSSNIETERVNVRELVEGLPELSEPGVQLGSEPDGVVG